MKEHYASLEKPWMKHYRGLSSGVQIPRCTMYREILMSCERNDRYEAKALHYYGAEMTYREMFACIDQYAAAFAALGVKKGEIVSFVSVCLPETMCELYALNKLGAVCSFIDPRTDAIHIREYIKKAGSRIVITLERNFSAVADHMDELGLGYVIGQTPASGLPWIKRCFFKLKTPKFQVPYDGRRIIRDGDLFRMGAGKSVLETAYEPDMPAVVTRTGGTTGLSKGVVLTNDNMNALAANFTVTIPFADLDHRFTQSFLNFLPIASSYGIAVGVHMAMSMTILDYLIPQFDPAKFDQLILRYKPRHIIGVPVFYEQLIYSDRMKDQDLSFIETMAAGGDSANESLEDKLDAFRLSHGIRYPIAQGYGMSEVSSAAAFGFRNCHRKGSAGIPCLFTTIAAFEPNTANELPIGQIGELCITGPTVMKEYLNEPEETENVLWKHPDGQIWMHSGDLGYLDEDGFLFIVGRIKRTIIRPDGHKVYPLQLEKVVMKHPAVSNCAVIPVKDLNHGQGEQPLIIIELGHEQYSTDSVTAEVLNMCRNEIKARGQPAGVVYVDKIPITDMAKNDYRRLTELYQNYNYLT